MKKAVIIGLSFIVLFIVTIACSVSIGDINIDMVKGDGDVIEEQRSVSGISRVRVANQGDLFIELGEQESLVIEAESNLMQYLESEVRAGELVLDTSNGVNLGNTKPIRYYLTVTELEGVAISSSGDIEAPALEADKFSIDVNSSGNVSVEGLIVQDLDVNISSSGGVAIDELTAGRLEVDISSSGNLAIKSGAVEQQGISISSSGDYDGGELSSQRANVRLTSSGNATVRVSDELTARLSSSGSLYYIGSPTIDAQESSSGDVIQLEE